MNVLGITAAILALWLALLPRPAQAASCTGRACTKRALAAPRREPVGPRKTDFAPDFLYMGLSASERAGALSRGIRSMRALVDSALEVRDCHASLCGPQSLTLRVGALDLGRSSKFPPIVGGLGAVVGALALTIKPGPRREPAPGPSLDGWAEGPKGLEPARPPFVIRPLISISDGTGGLRALVTW